MQERFPGIEEQPAANLVGLLAVTGIAMLDQDRPDARLEEFKVGGGKGNRVRSLGFGFWSWSGGGEGGRQGEEAEDCEGGEESGEAVAAR